MPPGGRKFVLLNHAHLPIAVLHILFEECWQGSSRTVPTPNLRALPYLPPTPDDPQIVFVILIPNQLFIEVAEALEHALSPTSVGYCVHVTFITDVVKLG